MLVVTPSTMAGRAMEAKTLSPPGAINQAELRRDRQRQQRASQRKTNSATGARNASDTAGHNHSQSDEQPAKTIAKLTTTVEHNEDATMAAARNIKLWRAPLLTTGAIHGQYYQ